MQIKSQPQLNQSLLLYRLPSNGDMPAAALLRANLFIILLIPLVAVSARCPLGVCQECHNSGARRCTL